MNQRVYLHLVRDDQTGASNNAREGRLAPRHDGLDGGRPQRREARLDLLEHRCECFTSHSTGMAARAVQAATVLGGLGGWWVLRIGLDFVAAARA